MVRQAVPELRSWAELVADAERNIDSPGVFTDILTADEIRQVEGKLALLRGEFDAIHRLDKLDWAICGVAGLLAALVDIFLVQMPQHPGFLGGEPSAGGPLANWIKGQGERRGTLQRRSSSLKLNSGPPMTQRLRSTWYNRWLDLAPAPIGFNHWAMTRSWVLFGVKDILQGTFTAINKTGKLIVQPAPLADPALLTMNLSRRSAGCSGICSRTSPRQRVCRRR